MQFDFPKIVRPIHLKEYAPEFGDAVVEVWVNPSRGERFNVFEMAKKHQELIRKMLEIHKDDPGIKKMQDEELAVRTEIYAWFANIWSQGKDPSNHWTVEEVEELHKSDTDPTFYAWLTSTTQAMINDWRMSLKKVSPPPS